MSNVVIWAPEARQAHELVAKAKELGLTPVVLHVGAGDPQAYVQHGAAKVLVADSPKLADFQSGPMTDALADAVKQVGAKAVFLSGGRRGKEIAPRLGVKLKAGVVTLAQKARSEGGKLVFERMFLGGKTLATEIPQSEVAIATFPARLFEPLPADAGAKGEVAKLAGEIRDSKVKVTKKMPRKESGVNLEAAPVVVGAGRGFKSKDDLKLAFDLAATMGGQVGCSRPLATDLGWLTDEYWIGLSGKEVKPKVYVAAGISGQIQHTTGIRNSKLIVAINTNKDAPIFKMADYGIVGDLYKVLPALQAAVKKQKGR
ncbi:MAG: electron transfer flavoprotein alpha subunit [Thermoplasmata archaeon]|jgi:electron transfer flavoprotein alpha subunit|nr:electron transfer flavoprotein alpha subunit [Thermoplasmata archaeon]